MTRSSVLLQSLETVLLVLSAREREHENVMYCDRR